MRVDRPLGHADSARFGPGSPIILAMANARRGSARTKKTKKTARPDLDGRYLMTRLAWLGLAVAWLLTATALISFDAADPPGTDVWPLNETVQNWIGVAGAYTSHAILSLVGIGAVPAMVAWLMALVWSAAGREFRHPFVRTAGAVLIVASVAGLAYAIVPSAVPAPGSSGGMVGVSAGAELVARTGMVGGVLILLAVLVAGLILSFDRLVFVAVGRVAAAFASGASRAKSAAATRAAAKKKVRSRVVATDLENAEVEIKQGKKGKNPTCASGSARWRAGSGAGRGSTPTRRRWTRMTSRRNGKTPSRRTRRTNTSTRMRRARKTRNGKRTSTRMRRTTPRKNLRLSLDMKRTTRKRMRRMMKLKRRRSSTATS